MTNTPFPATPFVSPTGATLALRHCPAAAPASGQARGIVQINHGLAEHAARYARFAGFLAARGYHVYAHDHRGHGGTRAPDAAPGLFAREDGVAKVLADIAAVHAEIRRTHPGLPVICFGHSMGGLIALNYAEQHPGNLDGLAVWNANFDAGAAAIAARAILATERFFLGSDVPSRILPRLTFEAWGKAVPDARTPFDWLSRDPAEVQAYIDDPLCGFEPTVSLWRDVFALVAAGPKNLDRLPPGLPVQLVGGAADPATSNGAAVQALARQLQKSGQNDVSLTILPDTRHESLNDINRTETMLLFADWADTVVRRQ
ncbi:alpha/beta hydrolase [Pseudohoeflea coraliihabitans]|uniref:Alpha/beta hydrolase n=1 Tax=Pseudohoeflea coraliihabitans TaxID=2860393 RepID=A0ABS6WJ23_9HYPH|nr:alpha/beta hydrolase [Pseudohoeflea sp. DP4N28-3]MBW3095947.1 alpha/beta hydrolase [Pseudohoeflea sp. DP4N28-3]